MKILLYDIENAPNVSYTWPGSMYEQTVIDVKENWQILSIAYKWLDEDKVHCITKQNQKDDRALIKKFWKVMNEADIVIAHNGVNFDNKKVAAKFLEYGLTPPSPFKTIDTLQVARNKFSLNSNRLDDLARLLGIGRKIKIAEGFELWLDVMANKPAAWKKMVEYNKHDVVLLEGVYKKLRPWMDKHPHVRLDGNLRECPKCGSTHTQRRGLGFNAQGAYHRVQCMSCGGWAHERAKIKSATHKLKNPA